MSIRTLITAICVAVFAAGPAAMQARASVQPSTERTGSAYVGATVDAVPAQSGLTGTFSWWLFLSNGETSALTNAAIHVTPPSGPAPPDLIAATIAPGANLQGYLPSTSGMVAPEFDSARTVSPGSADPGTHTQTVTVTLTPQAFALGYTDSWATVRITGGSTASNGAVCERPLRVGDRRRRHR